MKAGDTIDIFNRDVRQNAGYLYTTNIRLSSRLANWRPSRASLEATDFRRKRVIDVGCGDGVFTLELNERGQPTSIVGIDPASDAIELARAKASGQPISFVVGSAYDLPYGANTFDIAHLRSVLHHLDRPLAAVREALRVAPYVVVIEPNGYNPVLKFLERNSAYHIAHDERSYTARQLERWIREAGGNVIARQWVGLVPMFCPDWMARPLKFIEPVVEHMPLLRLVSCAVYVFAARRS